MVDLVVLIFLFDLVVPFYLLNWNCYFLACENLPDFSCHFWKHKSVYLEILHQPSVLSNITPQYFFSPKIIYFGQKEPIKVQSFDTALVKTHQISHVNFETISQFHGSHQSLNLGTFECSGESLPNSSCHFSNNKSVFLQILHHSSVSWKITPLYFFSSKIIYFGLKEPINVQIFETSKCSGQNLSNSLCQFWTTSQFLFKFCITLPCHER